MAKYHLRLHVRVRDVSQWAIMDELIFFPDAKAILDGVKPKGKSLIIDKTINVGFVLASTIYELTLPIEEHLGDAIVILDCVNGNKTDGMYSVKIGSEYSDSGFDVPTKLLATDINDIEAWVRALDKKVPVAIASEIKSYCEKPKNTQTTKKVSEKSTRSTSSTSSSWEKELKQRHQRFSKADKEQIIQILKEEFRIISIALDAKNNKDEALNILFSAGRIGCCHGRTANMDEIEVLSGVIEGFNVFLGMILSKKLEDDDINEIIRDIKPSINKYPQIASPFLNMVFAFVYADGEVETTDKRYIDRLEPIIASKLDYDETEPKVKSSKPSIIAPAKSTSNAKKPTVSSKPQTELSDEEIESKILDSMKDGERYITQDLHSFDENIRALSVQKLSAVLRKMTQKGVLIKVEENNIGYYYSVKALYDKTVKSFESAQKIGELKELIRIFNLLGGYDDANSYAEKCQEKIKEINYDEANQLMLNAKTPIDFKKAADAFKGLGNYRDSKSNLKLCNTRREELENSNSYDSAIKKMNAAKTSTDMTKVVALFEALCTYRDCKELVAKCKETAEALKEEERKQSVYNKAISKISSSDIAVLTQAATELELISGWRDVDVQVHRIRTKISDVLAEQERVKIELAQKEKKRKIITISLIAFFVPLIIFIIVYFSYIKPMGAYKEGLSYLKYGNYDRAIQVFEELGDFKDSKEQLRKSYQDKYPGKLIAFAEDMPYLSISDGAISGVGSVPSNLVIPDVFEGELVTEIASDSFGSRMGSEKTIKSVVIPSSVTKIGWAAFINCVNLETVKFNTESQLKSISSSAFSGTKIKTIENFTSVEEIGESAFSGSELTSIRLPNGLKTISEKTFSSCDYLTDIYIPKSVTYIEGYVFVWSYQTKTIHYDGTKEEWEKIAGWEWNRNCGTCIVYCSDGKI